MRFKQLRHLKKFVNAVNDESDVIVLTVCSMSMFSDGKWACTIETSSIFGSRQLLRVINYCHLHRLSVYVGASNNKPYLGVQ